MTWAKKLASKSKVSALEPDYGAHAAEAEALYMKGCYPQGPQWAIIGEACRGLWLYKTYLKAQGVEDWWSCKHTSKPNPQIGKWPDE